MTSISFPFRIGVQGAVVTTSDPAKVNLDRVRSVLSTQVGDRAMRPEFGTDIQSLVFDMERVGTDVLHSRVAQSFKDHLPGLHLVSTSVTFDGQDSQTGTLLVEFNGPSGETDVASVSFVDGIAASDPNLTSEVFL